MTIFITCEKSINCTMVMHKLFIEFIIISVIFAIMATVFGILGLKRGNKGIAKAGLILGVSSLAVTFLLFLFLKVLNVSLFTIPSWYK